MNQLTTEQRNQNTLNIDQLDGVGIARLINQEDHQVAEAVGTQSKAIGQAIEEITKRFQSGGRIIYVGAGTSGRLGALDAIELTPTYGVPATRAFGLLAGGERAMYAAVEGAEDSKQLAVNDLKKSELGVDDTVIAIAASGRTPYAIGALEYAGDVGALTVSVTCTEQNEMTKIAKIAINPVVGPEVITGSTRMKAGTAEKMVLNTISTGVMIKMGYVYSNLMINVQPTNDKLIARSTDILVQILGVSDEVASDLLQLSGKNVAVAIVMYRKDVDRQTAETLLADNGHLVSAIV